MGSYNPKVRHDNGAKGPMARPVGRMVTMFLLIMVPISQEFNVPLISVAFRSGARSR
jgi:hypothetical protein